MSKTLRPAVRAEEYRGVSQCHLHAAPRRRPRGVGGRHDGDGGEGVGGRCATALERRRAAFEDSHGFYLEFSCTGAHWLLTKRAGAQANWLLNTDVYPWPVGLERCAE